MHTLMSQERLPIAVAATMAFCNDCSNSWNECCSLLSSVIVIPGTPDLGCGERMFRGSMAIGELLLWRWSIGLTVLIGVSAVV
jgi:hypothetical protein